LTGDEQVAVGLPGDEQVAVGLDVQAEEARPMALKALFRDKNKPNEGGFQVGETLLLEDVEVVVVGTAAKMVTYVRNDKPLPPDYGSCEKKKYAAFKRPPAKFTNQVCTHPYSNNKENENGAQG
jgi:hypothetical protein